MPRPKASSDIRVRAYQLRIIEGWNLRETGEMIAIEFKLPSVPCKATVKAWSEDPDIVDLVAGQIDVATIKWIQASRLDELWKIIWQGYEDGELTLDEALKHWRGVHKDASVLHGTNAATRMTLESGEPARVSDGVAKLISAALEKNRVDV